MQILRSKFARESPTAELLLPIYHARGSVSEAQCPRIFTQVSTFEAQWSILFNQNSMPEVPHQSIYVWAATLSTYYFYKLESNDSQVSCQTKRIWSKTTTFQLQFHKTFRHKFARESPTVIYSCFMPRPKFCAQAQLSVPETTEYKYDKSATCNFGICFQSSGKIRQKHHF